MRAETGLIHTASPANQSGLSIFRDTVRKKARKYGVLRVVQSLGLQDSNQNSLLVRKVSRGFLGNGRFAESKSGDWFDLPLSGEGDGILAKVLAQGRTRVFSFGQPASLKLWNDEFDKLADVVHG